MLLFRVSSGAVAMSKNKRLNQSNDLLCAPLNFFEYPTIIESVCVRFMGIGVMIKQPVSLGQLQVPVALAVGIRSSSRLSGDAQPLIIDLDQVAVSASDPLVHREE